MGTLVNAQLRGHGVLDESDQGYLGRFPLSRVALDHRHALAYRQCFLDIAGGMRELAMEPVDAHNERQAGVLEVVDRREGLRQPTRIHSYHGTDGTLDEVIP